MFFYENGTGRARIRTLGGSDGLSFQHGTTDAMRLTSTGLGIGASFSPSFRLDVSGTGRASSDFRAPIFYDSDNTGYYLDPASISKLWSVQSENLGGSVLNRVTSNLGTATTFREAVTFIDGTTVQAHTSTGDGNVGNCYQWYTTESVFVDPEKDYEISYWVRSTGDDNIYFGWNELNAAGTTISSNPYFASAKINTNGTWVKRVALMRNWRTPSGQADTVGVDRYATTTSRNSTFDVTDGVMHSTTNRLQLRFGTCYGTVNGSKTYFHLASIREVTGHDRQSINYALPYFNGSTWQGSMNFRSRTHWDAISGIDIIGGSGEFRMSSDSGALNLRVDGWVLGTDYIQGGNAAYAPIYYDLNNTAFYFDGASTTNINAMSGNGKTMFETSDSYLRINQGSAFTAGCWFGSSHVLAGSGYIAAGSNGGTTTSRVWINSGTYNGVNVAYIDGSNGHTGCFISYADNSHRSPIFYDSNNTGYYVDPAGTSYVSGEFQVQQNGTSGFRILSPTGTQSLWVRAGYSGAPTPTSSFNNIQFQSSGSSGGTFNFWCGNALALSILGDYAEGAASLRAPIFYDSNNTGYYLDPASTSNLNRLVLQPRNDNYYVGSMTGDNPVSDWQSLTNVAGQFTVAQFNNFTAGGYSNFPANVYQFGAVLSWRTTNHSFQMYAAHTGDMAIKTQWNNDNYSGWMYPVFHNRTNGPGGDLRATIYYDQNNTAFYVDPASTSVLNRISTVRTNDWLYIDQNYGHSVVGVYSSVRYQGVFAMGDSYKLPADGTTTGNLYGIAWSYPSAGGAAGNLASHGMLILENGAFKGAWGGGRLVTPADIRGTLYYDYDNTGYYLDPGGTSNFATTVTGNMYFLSNRDTSSSNPPLQAYSTGGLGAIMSFHRGGVYAVNFGLDSDNVMRIGGWSASNSLWQLDMSGNNTLLTSSRAPIFYYSSDTSIYLGYNTSSSYTQWRIGGSKNSYGGIYDVYSAVNGMMYDSGGNGGVYREANGRWYFYHNVGNNCLGIGASTTSSSYYLYVSGAIYSTGNIVAYSDVRKKENIETINGALNKVNSLRGVYYNRKDDESKTRQIGVIAQEVEKVLPEAVTYAEDVDEYGVSYGNMVGLLIEAIKEQQKQIEELQRAVLKA